VSRTPGYNGAGGMGWLERGGITVTANIRGGGEYGPIWHTQAQKAGRHLVYEDFASVAREKGGSDDPSAAKNGGDLGYFSALQIPLMSGRFFSENDPQDRGRRIVVSSQMAKQYFPGESSLGKHIHVDWNGSTDDYEIVGVVGDTLYKVGHPSKPTMYFPVLSGIRGRERSLVVRTFSDPLALSLSVQKQIAALDAGLPVSNVLTMQQIIGQSTANASFSATLVLAFAVLSLLLAAIGLYGVLSYLVAQRVTEIGIRIALGARREQVLRLVLMDGLRPVFYGLAIGLAGGAGVGLLIRSMLYGTKPLDTFDGVPEVLRLEIDVPEIPLRPS